MDEGVITTEDHHSEEEISGKKMGFNRDSDEDQDRVLDILEHLDIDQGGHIFLKREYSQWKREVGDGV